MKQCDIALLYAEKGISVFPCRQDKRPATRNGFLDATTDVTTIKKWWRRNPSSLIGSPNSNFTVLDVDDHGICSAGKMLTENALYRLFKDTIPTGVVTVQTISGGRHFYFKKTDGVTRRINALPNIDLLGDGGFVILPDQKNYIADTPLWESINELPEFKLEAFDKLSHELSPASKLAKDLKNTHRKGVVVKSTSKAKPDTDYVPKTVEMLVSEEASKEGIDYKTGKMRFVQTPDMYKKQAEYDIDESILLKYKDGKLDVGIGELNSQKINTLFHYPPIQARLAGFLGLMVPDANERTLMHSVLPGHPDVRPSMGVRWSADGTHILVRDFSNHFTDAYSQLDYNVVRLYATMRYKTLVPRMKAPEFVVWFLRLMVDAEIIDVSKFKKKYALPRFGDGIWKVAAGFQLLDAIKQLYDGYDGTSTFADRFSAAWCGVEPSAANRAKKALHEGGYLNAEGVCDCSGGTRADGFYNTKVFSLVDKEKVLEINKKTKTLKEGLMKEEQRHVTLRGLSVSEESYESIKNFCADYKIENVPLRKNMFVETTIVDGLVQKEAPETDNSFAVTELRLVVAPAMSGVGEVLMITGESTEIEELFDAEVEEFENLDADIISDEPMIGVVISYDFDTNVLDIPTLELKMKDYLQDKLLVDTFFIRYTTSESLFGSILDGKEPEDE